MDVGAVERLLRSLAFEGLGGLEFRVPAEVARWFFAATRFRVGYRDGPCFGKHHPLNMSWGT